LFGKKGHIFLFNVSPFGIIAGKTEKNNRFRTFFHKTVLLPFRGKDTGHRRDLRYGRGTAHPDDRGKHPGRKTCFREGTISSRTGIPVNSRALCWISFGAEAGG
jgi:hypothetical protein